MNNSFLAHQNIKRTGCLWSCLELLFLFAYIVIQTSGTTFFRKNIFFIHTIKASSIPADPLYDDNEWAYDMISAEQAWDISLGNRDVKVAIIDSGITASHNDLNDNLANYFFATYYHDYPLSNYSFHDYDSTGHGTRVAGVIGAEGNNNLGINGICWKTSLVPLSYNDMYETYHHSYTASAISISTQFNIPIINFSSAYFGSMDDDVEANLRQYPGLFVCSAGNLAIDMDANSQFVSNPSELENIDNLISVGALANDGSIYSTSCFGATSVDLFAPGDHVWTTGYSQDSYATISQTSCAAAFVSGTAALLKSINPDLTTSQLKSAILDNVDVVDELVGKCTTGGKLNVYKAALSVIPELISSTTRSVDSCSYNWVKIIVDSPCTYNFTLTGSPNLELRLSNGVESYYVPLETSTIETGYASTSFNYLFGTPGTYYLRVKNNLSYKTNYTLSKSFVSFHNHSFTGDLIYVDGQYHGRTCECGAVGNLTMHVPKSNNPYICRFCNGLIAS